MNKTTLTPNQQIEEMVGALTDAIIVYPGGWMDSVPVDLKQRITLQRLVRLMQGDLDLATDAECCAYLMTASLEAPMQYEWVKIYGYCFTQAMGDKCPADMRVESLDDHMMGQLDHFKRWIRKRQLMQRKERQRDEIRQKKAAGPQQQLLPLELEYDQEVTSVA